MEGSDRAAVVWSRAVAERVRTSLFAVPALWIAGFVVLSQLAIWLDLSTADADLPSMLDTTAESARSLLAAVASGTIAAASLVFSLTFVAIQLSASSYSSRVLRELMGDRFQQHVYGIVLGTFAYSLLVLRVVRGPLEEGGEVYLPRISVFGATVFAVASLVALLASINHTAQGLRVDAVSRRLLDALLAAVDERLGDSALDRPGEPVPDGAPLDGSGEPAVVESVERGWVQQVDALLVAQQVGSGGSARLDVAVGSYVMAGTPLMAVWCGEGELGDDEADLLRAAVQLGAERTLQQDLAYGLVMLEDLVLRALSPGVNDQNTAASVIPLLGDAVLEILARDLPPQRSVVEGCRIDRSAEPRYADYVEVAFEQIRVAAADHAHVTQVLDRTLASVAAELERRGLDDREGRRSSIEAMRQRL